MITVYGAWPTRSFRVIWVLEELGLEYRIRPVDLRQRLADPEFVALNPAGFLPAIEDDGVSMVDSIAILEYIIVRYGGGRLRRRRTIRASPPISSFCIWASPDWQPISTLWSLAGFLRR